MTTENQRIKELEITNKIQDLNSNKIHKLLIDLEEANLKIKEASSQKELFFATISHEIRTPLNAISGFIELILSNDSQNLTDSQKKNLQIVSNSSNHLSKIVNQFLSYTKIQNNSFEINENQYNTLDFFNQIKSIFDLEAQNKKIQFKLDLEENYPEFLFGDFIKIEQIISNLLVNAFKFSPEGKVELIISFEKINSKKTKLIVKVKDNGIGIKKDDLDLIFDHFKQIKSEVSIKNSFGLGLAICKEFLTILNGKLDIESSYKIGSTFSLEIPQKIIKSPILTSKKSNAKDYSKLKVLIADDNNINLLYLSKILSNLKVKFDSVSSGDEVLNSVNKNKYHLLLIDWSMPGIHGETLINELKKNVKQKFKIAIISANLNLISKNALKDIDGFLNKPFIPSEISILLNDLQGDISIYKNFEGELKLETLNKICLDNSNLKNNIIKIFIKEFLFNLIELEIAILDKDLRLIKDTAHKMISSSKTFDLHNITDFLEQFESFSINEIHTENLKLISQLKIHKINLEKFINELKKINKKEKL